MVVLFQVGLHPRINVMVDLKYSEAIQKCAEMYEGTYGCKTVEIMQQKREEFDKYVEKVAKKFVAPVQQIIKDSSNIWSKLHLEKLE